MLRHGMRSETSITLAKRISGQVESGATFSRASRKGETIFGIRDGVGEREYSAGEHDIGAFSCSWPRIGHRGRFQVIRVPLSDHFIGEIVDSQCAKCAEYNL